MAEAPGSRTQPPRVGGERPILKTGRATGPRSLPDIRPSPTRPLPKRVSQDRWKGGSRVKTKRSARSAGGLEGKNRARQNRSPGLKEGNLAFDQPNLSSAWSLLRLLDAEVHSLTFSEELEHSAADRATMKEMLNTAFVADEAEPLVNQQTCDRPTRHAVPPKRVALVLDRANSTLP